MAWRLPALKAEAKTVKAMKTPAAKAKGMRPDTKTMKATKTPAAKAKGMKLKTKTMNVMKTPVAKENMKARRLPAAKVDASQRTLIRIDDPAEACVIHLTSSMPYCEEILRRLQPKDRRLHAVELVPKRLLHDDGEVRRWPV